MHTNTQNHPVNRFLRRLLPILPAEPAKSSMGPQDGRTVGASALASLDIDAALEEHRALKRRLLECTHGHCDVRLNAEALCFDDRCRLGLWLHGPAKPRLGHYRGFVDLLEQHRMFHIVASNVVTLSRAGRHEQAAQMATVQLEAFSTGVQRRLKSMRAWAARRTPDVDLAAHPAKATSD